MMKVLQCEKEKCKYRRVEKWIRGGYVVISLLTIFIVDQSGIIKLFTHKKDVIFKESVFTHVIKEILLIACLSLSGMFLLLLLYKRYNTEYHI